MQAARGAADTAASKTHNSKEELSTFPPFCRESGAALVQKLWQRGERAARYATWCGETAARAG
jgi:hypothetical protein